MQLNSNPNNTNYSKESQGDHIIQVNKKQIIIVSTIVVIILALIINAIIDFLAPLFALLKFKKQVTNTVDVVHTLNIDDAIGEYIDDVRDERKEKEEEIIISDETLEFLKKIYNRILED